MRYSITDDKGVTEIDLLSEFLKAVSGNAAGGCPVRRRAGRMQTGSFKKILTSVLFWESAQRLLRMDTKDWSGEPFP